MPPQQNQPTNTPINPEMAEGVKGPEVQGIPSPEVKPEILPQTPEKPAQEKFSDQSTQVPVPAAPIMPPVIDQPVQTAPPQVPVSEDDEAASGVPEMDKAWVEAVDTVIENDEDKPYEEEEDSEKLQIDYLSKRFGKKIDKE